MDMRDGTKRHMGVVRQPAGCRLQGGEERLVAQMSASIPIRGQSEVCVVVERSNHGSDRVESLVGVRGDDAAEAAGGAPAPGRRGRRDLEGAAFPRSALLVKVELEARQFFCGEPAWARQIFAEQVDGLTRRHARRTIAQRSLLTSIAIALAGEPVLACPPWLVFRLKRQMFGCCSSPSAAGATGRDHDQEGPAVPPWFDPLATTTR
ncbi:hypothetical protein ACWGH8_04770 [Nonomuraea muscovyensis]